MDREATITQIPIVSHTAESSEHVALKKTAVRLLKAVGAHKIIVEASTTFGPIVDVLGFFGNHKTVAIECGHCDKNKIDLLKEHFTVGVHLPYCYTSKLVFHSHKVLVDKIEDELMNASAREVFGLKQLQRTQEENP